MELPYPLVVIAVLWLFLSVIPRFSRDYTFKLGGLECRLTDDPTKGSVSIVCEYFAVCR